MKTICEYLEEDKIKWADMPYISVKKDGVFTSRSFSEVISDVRNFAAALEAEGLSGTNIMLYSPNSYEWAVISLGVMGYVGTLVPIDKEWTAFDIENAMSSIEIGAVFYERSKEEIISDVRKKLTPVRFFCINDHFEKLVSKGGEISPKPDGIRDLSSRAMIIFTSGTTNMPKAIPLTQSNLFNNWETLYKRTPMTVSDRSYIFLPLNHVYAGVANFLYTIISGMQIFLCSDMSLMIDEMLEIRPTVVCTVPLILNKIYSVMNDEIMKMLKEIRFLYCGGSFTDPAMKKYFIDSGVTLLEAYGTTETSSVIALGVPGDEKIDSAGVIFENLDVRIIAPDENGIGEIIVGGGSVSSGYISRNDTYSEFDSQGFYHTGDLGYIDESRHLYLKGRKKRMIITANGKNVYVDELEKLLTDYPEIMSAAVFEEDHHPAARIYTNSSEEEINRIIKEVNEKLPKFKHIRNVHIKKDTPGGRIK